MSVQTLLEKPIRKAAKFQPSSSLSLDQVVNVIVHQFRGDTQAFFESVRAKQPKPKQEECEVKLVRKFAKCL